MLVFLLLGFVLVVLKKSDETMEKEREMDMEMRRQKVGEMGRLKEKRTMKSNHSRKMSKSWLQNKMTGLRV